MLMLVLILVENFIGVQQLVIKNGDLKMNKDILKGIGITILSLMMITCFFLAGYNFALANSITQQDLEETYMMGALQVGNNALTNGFTKICDFNNTCVTLYEESFIQKQLNNTKESNI